MALGKGVTVFNPMLGSTSWALYFGMACPPPLWAFTYQIKNRKKLFLKCMQRAPYALKHSVYHIRCFGLVLKQNHNCLKFSPRSLWWVRPQMGAVLSEFVSCVLSSCLASGPSFPEQLPPWSSPLVLTLHNPPSPSNNIISYHACCCSQDAFVSCC